MKKLGVFIIVLLITIIACQSNEESSKANGKEPSIMYKDSELALLMRHMFDEGMEWKNAIEKDSLQTDFPADYYGIYTVQATDSAVRTPKFMALGDAYLKTVKDLVETKKQKKQVKKFNTMVESCINCHQVFCQGPIDKIQQLYIIE